MYAEKYASLKKGSVAIKTNSGRGNLTGIPTSMKNQYEAASGLSFDDVRVHYNSEKPGKMQALAYTQGNHVYIGPGQERHLQHELGHVIQQKQGIVRPNVWINGLPVNTDRGLEQQAESGIIPLVRTAPESRQDIVQGVFLVYQEGILVEAPNKEDFKSTSINTMKKPITESLGYLVQIEDPNLKNKINMEINSRFEDLSNNIMEILAYLYGKEDYGKRIINELNNDCFNYLIVKMMKMEKQMREEYNNCKEKDRREQIRAGLDIISKMSVLFSVRFKDSGTEDEKFYKNIEEKAINLSHLINDTSVSNNEQAVGVIRSEIVSLIKLRECFMWDRKMLRKPLLDCLNALKKAFNDKYGSVKISEDIHTFGIDDYNDELVSMPITYATTKSQEVQLPEYDQLQEALNRKNPIERSGVVTKVEDKKNLAKDILEYLDKAESSERLVIYRGMGMAEAHSILALFNSEMATAVEAAVRSGSINIHDEKNIASLGKHYGERIQAEKYITDTSQEAKVLLAFILKPGAKKLLFSQSLLALPKNLDQDTKTNTDRTPRVDRSGFEEASSDEGTLSTYIGIKREKVKVGDVEKPTFSLGVAQGDEGKKGFTQLLLQLLIDRVEVVEMRLSR